MWNFFNSKFIALPVNWMRPTLLLTTTSCVNEWSVRQRKVFCASYWVTFMTMSSPLGSMWNFESMKERKVINCLLTIHHINKRLWSEWLRLSKLFSRDPLLSKEIKNFSHRTRKRKKVNLWICGFAAFKRFQPGERKK